MKAREIEVSAVRQTTLTPTPSPTPTPTPSPNPNPNPNPNPSPGQVMFKSVPAFMPLLLQALLGWSGMQFLELEINPEYFMRRRELEAAADATKAKCAAPISRRYLTYISPISPLYLPSISPTPPRPSPPPPALTLTLTPTLTLTLTLTLT